MRIKHHPTNEYWKKKKKKQSVILTRYSLDWSIVSCWSTITGCELSFCFSPFNVYPFIGTKCPFFCEFTQFAVLNKWVNRFFFSSPFSSSTVGWWCFFIVVLVWIWSRGSNVNICYRIAMNFHWQSSWHWQRFNFNFVFPAWIFFHDYKLKLMVFISLILKEHRMNLHALMLFLSAVKKNSTITPIIAMKEIFFAWFM